MGTISVSIPLVGNFAFKIKDEKVARELVDELIRVAERKSLDQVLGIWKERAEEEGSLTAALRAKNNRRVVLRRARKV